MKAAAIFLLTLYLVPASVSGDFDFVDLEDVPNPDWETLKDSLTLGENSLGPAEGSTIQVLAEEGPYKDREIPRRIALHTPTHSSVRRRHFDDMTRWYQEDGNTQIFRMFPGDDNVRNGRENAPRSEVYGLVKWKRGDGWYEWSGTYTFIKVRNGCIFQIKHNRKYWSMQLRVKENDDDDGTFDLVYAKLRDPDGETILERDVVHKSIDIKVLDDGTNHMVYVNGELRVEGSMTDRSDDESNRARWGIYSPRSPMDRDILIFVTGAFVGKALDDP